MRILHKKYWNNPDCDIDANAELILVILGFGVVIGLILLGMR